MQIHLELMKALQAALPWCWLMARSDPAQIQHCQSWHHLEWQENRMRNQCQWSYGKNIIHINTKSQHQPYNAVYISCLYKFQFQYFNINNKHINQTKFIPKEQYWGGGGRSIRHEMATPCKFKLHNKKLTSTKQIRRQKTTKTQKHAPKLSNLIKNYIWQQDLT